jgi:hypothetical protein
VSAKHAHLHRKHSWARLRERAAVILEHEARVASRQGGDLSRLLWCIVVPSLAGLAVAGLLHLWWGLR